MSTPTEYWRWHLRDANGQIVETRERLTRLQARLIDLDARPIKGTLEVRLLPPGCDVPRFMRAGSALPARPPVS